MNREFCVFSAISPWRVLTPILYEHINYVLYMKTSASIVISIAKKTESFWRCLNISIYLGTKHIFLKEQAYMWSWEYWFWIRYWQALILSWSIKKKKKRLIKPQFSKVTCPDWLSVASFLPCTCQTRGWYPKFLPQPLGTKAQTIFGKGSRKLPWGLPPFA